jgi:hypothetical protein
MEFLVQMKLAKRTMRSNAHPTLCIARFCFELLELLR